MPSPGHAPQRRFAARHTRRAHDQTSCTAADEIHKAASACFAYRSTMVWPCGLACFLAALGRLWLFLEGRPARHFGPLGVISEESGLGDRRVLARPVQMAKCIRLGRIVMVLVGAILGLLRREGMRGVSREVRAAVRKRRCRR
jgi:hypothetical protein